MVIAFAVGLRRALTPGVGARWAPRLVAVYGAGLVAAGVFRADPALGFPVGTPDGPEPVSWHGMLHFARRRDRLHLPGGRLLRARPPVRQRRPAAAGRRSPG